MTGDRVWFVNPAKPKKKKAAPRFKKYRGPLKHHEPTPLERCEDQLRQTRDTRDRLWLAQERRRLQNPKKKRIKKHNPKAGTMATKKKKRTKKRAPKAVYKAARSGGSVRRVKRANPRRKHKRRAAATTHHKRHRSNPKRTHHRRRTRRNPKGLGFMAPLLAVGAGFVTGVLVRVGTHMAAPGGAVAAKAVGGALALGGVFMATKMKNPLYGIGVAVGALDAALQNDATFKAEMALAPAATQQALGAIVANNLRGMENARSLPGYARMGALPAYARMGAIVANNMQGFASGQIEGMRTRNPFE